MVIKLKKRHLALASGILALFVILALALSASSAQAADCASVNVIVLGQSVVACVPTSSLPTVTATATLPNVTIRPPAVTVTVPTTITVRPPAITVPGSVSTVTLPRATSTVTQIVSVPAGGGTPVTITGGSQAGNTVVTKNVVKTVTISNGMRSTSTDVSTPRQTAPTSAKIDTTTVTSTVTATERPATPEKEVVTVTKLKAVGISLLLVLIGAILALLLLRMSYTYGWIRGDGGNRKFIQEVTDDLRYDK